MLGLRLEARLGLELGLAARAAAGAGGGRGRTRGVAGGVGMAGGGRWWTRGVGAAGRGGALTLSVAFPFTPSSKRRVRVARSPVLAALKRFSTACWAQPSAFGASQELGGEAGRLQGEAAQG